MTETNEPKIEERNELQIAVDELNLKNESFMKLLKEGSPQELIDAHEEMTRILKKVMDLTEVK